MWNDWFFFTDVDGDSSRMLPIQPFNFGCHLFLQFNSLADSSMRQSRFLYIPGSIAFQEALGCMSKFAGAFLFWFGSSSSSNLSRQIPGNLNPRPQSCKYPTQVWHHAFGGKNLSEFPFGSISKGECCLPLAFGKISSFIMRILCREAERFQSFPLISLAAAIVPPFDNLCSKVMAVPLENVEVQMHRSIDQRPCEVEHHGPSGLSYHDLKWARHAVEPRTGIEFPTVLDNILIGGNKSHLASEVLVGTGSRTMTIVRIKSLKVYAFGFYVHPNSVCEKLGPKYASFPVSELNKCCDFYEDLLREDIDMTVRLVINCNGMKINTVKDAFEKSLQARLRKTKPDTDYHCLKTFGSFFTKDIPLPAGTTVDFRRTSHGQLITEIEGNQIGVVHSKDLCRAFFDMYIGDVPVSEQAKEEIGKNVASIIRKC